MGQKIHPLGFRLGIIKNHKSIWFTKFKKYSLLVKEDNNIRSFFKPWVIKATISNIAIKRNNTGDKIEINIETARPGVLVGPKNCNIELILKDLKKNILKNKLVKIKITEIKDIDSNPSVLSQYIAAQIEKRVPYRRAMKNALQQAESVGVKGIKIQVSGRLNGAEMARSEWIREGKLPLQTLFADIDYATAEAKTLSGIIGIKVWVFKE